MAMSSARGAAPAAHTVPDVVSHLLARYECGPIQFAGSENTFYERHLLFDRAIDPHSATPRDQFEAFARSVRDVLAQRWALTTETYARENPKLVYYYLWSS
jgi:glycogen phosphorylase